MLTPPTITVGAVTVPVNVGFANGAFKASDANVAYPDRAVDNPDEVTYPASVVDKLALVMYVLKLAVVAQVLKLAVVAYALKLDVVAYPVNANDIAVFTDVFVAYAASEFVTYV